MSLFDLSSVVGSLASHTVTVQRFAPDAYDANGVALPRTSTSFSIRASVQPVTGAELSRLPDGFNDSELVSVWTATPLKYRDRLTVPGRGAFEVQHLDFWNESGAYTKAIAKRLDATEPRA